MGNILCQPSPSTPTARLSVLFIVYFPNAVVTMMMFGAKKTSVSVRNILHRIVETSPQTFPSLFGNWDTTRYDFHYFTRTAPAALQTYWEGQQDALLLTWTGHIGGTDGGVRWQAELMGAG